MYWTKLKLFVYDFLIAIFVIISTLFGLNEISYIKLNLTTVGAICIFIYYFGHFVNNAAMIGLKGIFDFFLKNYKCVDMRVKEIFPKNTSFFSTEIEWRKGEKIRKEHVYYSAVLENENAETLLVFSSEFIHLQKEKKYRFVIGGMSKILFEAKDIPRTGG